MLSQIEVASQTGKLTKEEKAAKKSRCARRRATKAELLQWINDNAEAGIALDALQDAAKAAYATHHPGYELPEKFVKMIAKKFKKSDKDGDGLCKGDEVATLIKKLMLVPKKKAADEEDDDDSDEDEV